MKKTHQNDENSTNNRNRGKAQGFGGRGGRPLSTLLGMTGHRGGAAIGIVTALALFLGMAGLTALCADDLTGNGAAQPEGSIEGSWVGKLVVGKSALTIVFNVKSENGGYGATMDSPDQGARGIPVSKLTVVGAQVRFEVKAVNGSYSGRLTQDGTRIVGQWQQSGMSLPLELEKKPQLSEGKPEQEQASNDKPTQQGPALSKDTPYDEVEVRFPSLDIEFSAAQNGDRSESKSPAPDGAPAAILAGTLTMPRGQGEGPFPAVVLVSGSGLQNRDEEIMGHKPFKVIADYLARCGIAVLRYDDRGFGQSTGDASLATTFDFARDACGALEFLAKTAGIDAKRLGVIGHSEGGIVAAIIAAQQGRAPQQGQEIPEASLIVMLAGPGVRGDELLLEQNRALALASGAPEEQIEKVNALNSKIYSIAIKKDSVESRRQEIVGLLKNEAPELEAQAESIAAQALSPWVVQFLKIDPAGYLRKVTIPVLALNGTKDLQVPAATNLPTIDRALKEAGNTHYRLVALDGLNHLFQHAKTGLPEEYAQLKEDFAPEALALMGDWIRSVIETR